MKQGFKSEHWKDANGNPAGGCTYGTGFSVSWQNGPLKQPALIGHFYQDPNGAFVEDVLKAVEDRLSFYQTTKFVCEENTLALQCIKQALKHLESRTKDRESRHVEGTHEL